MLKIFRVRAISSSVPAVSLVFADRGETEAYRNDDILG